MADIVIIANAAYRQCGEGDLAFSKSAVPLDPRHKQLLLDGELPRLRMNGNLMDVVNMRSYLENDRQIEASRDTRGESKEPGESRGGIRFLNGIYLTDYMLKRGFTVDLINHFDEQFDEFQEALAKNPVAVALSTTFLNTYQSIVRVVQTIRRLDPDVPLIAGGPQINFSYKTAQSYTKPEEQEYMAPRYFFFDEEADRCGVDYYIIENRGEQTLASLVDALKRNHPVEDVPNLAYFNGKGRQYTRREREEIPISEQVIDWENLPERYLGPVVSIEGSVGCPYKCKFCNFNAYADVLDSKSTEQLRQELKSLGTRSFVKEVFFTDDNFFLSARRIKDVCMMIIEEGLGFGWSSFIRAGAIKPENVDLIRDSHCKSLYLGVESGDLNVLRNMNKRSRPEKYQETTRLLNDRGISASSTLIFGFPGETEESIANTVSLLNSYTNSGWAFNVFVPFLFTIYPFSPIEEDRERHGLEGHLLDWRHNTMDAADAFRKMVEAIFQVRNAYIWYTNRDFVNPYGYDPTTLRDIFETRTRLTELQFKGNGNGQPDPASVELWNHLERVMLPERFQPFYRRWISKVSRRQTVGA